MILEGIILIADGKPDKYGEIINIDAIDWGFGRPVPVMIHGYGTPAGEAILSQNQDQVIATILLSRSNPSTLQFVPCVRGSVVKRDAAGVISRLVIDGIDLSPGNADARIKQLSNFALMSHASRANFQGTHSPQYVASLGASLAAGPLSPNPATQGRALYTSPAPVTFPAPPVPFPSQAESRINRVNQDTCEHDPVPMIFSSYCKKCNKTL